MGCYRAFFVSLVLLSAITLVITNTGRPAVPNPNITVLNSTSLRVTWDAYTPDIGPVSYNVTSVISELPNSSVTITFQAVNNTNQSIEINNLFPYTLYEVTITGMDRLGEVIDPTTLIQRTAAALPSGFPANISLRAVSSNQINLTWSVDVRNMNGILKAFNIYYSPAIITNSNVVVRNVTLGEIGPYKIQLRGLPANTYHDVSVSIVNNVGEGMKFIAGRAKTFPQVPVDNLPPVTTPITNTPTSVLIRIPAQPLFPTADIAAIYIIVEDNTPPVFPTYSNTQVYNPVSSSRDGLVLLNGVAMNSIRIQAVLDPSYFNVQNDYFDFNVGDGVATSYNGLTVANSPLDPSTTYHISLYTLFEDEIGQTSAAFSLITSLFTKAKQTETPTESCLSCFLPSIIVFALLVLLFIAVAAIIVSYWVYCTRFKKISLPPVPPVVAEKKLSLRKQRMKPRESLVFANPNAENPPALDIESKK